MNRNVPETDSIEEAARLWAIRVQDPAFSDWDAFAAWLESAPHNLEAYEAVLERIEDATDLLAAVPASTPAWQAEPEPEPRTRRHWWFGGAAAAAAAVAGVASWSVLDRTARPELIATGPGEQRVVELADGSRIILNGGTQVTVDRDTPRHVELAQGEALFEIRHDARNPFVVVTGDTRLVDAGTVFNVIAEKGALDVAVAEGAVIYQPGAGEVRLDAGDALWRPKAGAAPILRSASPGDIGGWKTGALHYDAASLDRIAQDLTRNLGRPVTLSGGAATRFTGTLMLNGPPDEVLARAGPLLGVRFTANREGWTMTPVYGSR